MIEETTRKRLPAAERRAVIVEEAGRLFGDRGYDATRLDDVAAAAGVTKPVLYRHFADKEALYLALLQRHRDDLPRLAGAVPAEGTLEERLRAVLDAWLGYVETHAYAWQMLFRDMGGGPAVQAFRIEVHARARTVLEGFIATLGGAGGAGIPEHEREPLAELMSMGMASLVLWSMEQPGVSREALLDAMTRVWTGLLR
jgi:AcrR family transcriptional regulator